MREINFRAWDISPYYDEEDKKHEMIYFNLEETRIIENLSLESVVMQYTGLKDKTGKEIYEGDIYHMGDKNIRYVVVYEDAGFKGKQLGTSSYAGLTYWRENIEVIGNIYKNPLLGVKQWK
ncbi:hypothetical protein DP122_00300 [Clostridium tetani]|uniref:YopX family protein n=1 Tax=Clostridium tetani TaxID=1513 RepID=UPI00100B570B|nr:YopX family protein [Clostridium tetani]RXI57257.1 hypothetical protein DP122_00300 [Clostridium tetani]